jgi:hypothetical protein
VAKKKKSAQIDFGSYSDLFMVLSFVFLLLYVISTLNSGVALIQEKHKSQSEQQKLRETVAKYERTLENELTEEQKKEFEELNRGLDRLKAEAQEAREYQKKMVEIAETKERELEEYRETVKTMFIGQVKSAQALKKKEELLERTKSESEAKLREQNRTIASLQEDLSSKAQAIAAKEQEVAKRRLEVEKIQQQVSELTGKQKLAQAQEQHLKVLQQTLSSKENELTKALASQKNLQAEREELERSSQEQLAQLKRESSEALEKTIAEGESKVAAAEAKYKKATEGLRKEIAGALAKSFSEAGLDVSVNPATGDVIVNFKSVYFDYNSSVLKTGMRDELKGFIPLYAKGLFENQRFANAIASIEIIGSSSPSFKGKYVDPRSIASEVDQKAVNYNLDLSYRRARGIFDFMFFTKNFNFEHKNSMLPLVKVSGTGYLSALEELKELPKDSRNEKLGFCGVYDCLVYQKVTLRFSLKDKVSPM